MQQLGRMHVFEAFQDLVDDILLVDFLENVVGSDHCVEVGLHVFEDQVDVFVVFGTNQV